MFLSESIWIKEKINTLDLPSGSQVLDIGSSTLEFKRRHQPYIEENVFIPLRDRGLVIVHADKKIGPGVDKIIDIEHAVNFDRKFDLVICTSVLEHLVNVKAATKNILSLVNAGGYLLVSVPFVCPYHPDPIDTLFRPSSQELADLFPGQRILAAAIISSPSPTFGLAEEKVSIVLLQIISPTIIRNSFKCFWWLALLGLKNLAYKNKILGYIFYN